MKYLYVNTISVILVYSPIARGNLIDFFSTDTNTTTRQFNGLEVPDSSLLLIDRITSINSNNRNSSLIKARKQAQETEETETSVGPCTCSLGVCNCCTGPVLDYFRQKACMRVTYHPGDFAFDVAMSFNDRVLYENSLTGKNPRPICINAPRLPNLKVCAKFYNVFFPGRNFHFCLAFVGQWQQTELFNMPFDCLRMGANGIAMMKPDDSGGLPIPNPQGGVDAVVDTGDDIEDYDENVVKSLLNIFDR